MKKKNAKKKVLITAAIVVILLSIGITVTVSGLSEGKNVVLDGIELAGIPDGSYTGAYEHGRWTNTLTVHIGNGKITGVDIVKDVAAAGVTNCSEEVFRRVVEYQDTRVDAVSRATVTSKAYLKAIENALNR